MAVRIKLSLARLSADQKIALGNRVYLGISNHSSDFSSPDPSLGDFDTAIQEATESKTTADLSKASADLAVAKEKILVLENFLRRLASYVIGVAANNEALVISAGFDLAADPKNKKKPERVTGVLASSTGNQGELEVSWNKEESREIYFLEMATVNSDGTVTAFNVVKYTRKTKHIVNGLSSGIKYAFRVCAVNSVDKGDYSDFAQAWSA